MTLRLSDRWPNTDSRALVSGVSLAVLNSFILFKIELQTALVTFRQTEARLQLTVGERHNKLELNVVQEHSKLKNERENKITQDIGFSSPVPEGLALRSNVISIVLLRPRKLFQSEVNSCTWYLSMMTLIPGEIHLWEVAWECTRLCDSIPGSWLRW